MFGEIESWWGEASCRHPVPHKAGLMPVAGGCNISDPDQDIAQGRQLGHTF